MAATVPNDETRPRPVLDPGPVLRPEGWLQHVNEPQTEAEVDRLRRVYASRSAVWQLVVDDANRRPARPAGQSAFPGPSEQTTGEPAVPF